MKLGKTTQVQERVISNDMFVGMSTFNVLAINPTKEELAELLGTTPDRIKDPVYINDKAQVINAKGEEIEGTEVTFRVYIKAVQSPIKDKPFITSLKFRVKQGIFIGTNTGKHQVIDAYGQSTWVTPEQFSNKEVPSYSNINPKYRHAYRGEVEFINFIKSWLGIEDPVNKKWDNNEKKFTEITWKTGEDLDACEVNISIEDWKKIFKGDFSAIKSLVKGHESFSFKAICGVNTSEDGKEYQVVDNKVFRNDATANTSSVKKEIERLLSNNNDRYWVIAKIKGILTKIIPNNLTKVTPVAEPTHVESGFEDFSAVNDTNDKAGVDDLPFGNESENDEYVIQDHSDLTPNNDEPPF